MSASTTVPDLSVVVVTHNSRELAGRTLASAAEAARGLDVEWIVVDSGSTDGTADAIEGALPGLTLLRRGNVGFAAGNNIGIDRARGRYVLLLNPDVEIRRGTFPELLAAMDARPGVGCASVVQRGGDGELQHSIRRFPSVRAQFGEALHLHRFAAARDWQEEVTDPRAYAEETAADWLVGAFLLLRRETLQQVGTLDERFFLYSEEKDLCLRIVSAGWEIRHLPDFEITHLTPGYTRPELAAQLTRSKVLFARKHSSVPRRAALRAGMATGHAVRLAMCAARSPVRPEARRRARGERIGLEIALGVRRVPPLEAAVRKQQASAGAR